MQFHPTPDGVARAAAGGSKPAGATYADQPPTIRAARRVQKRHIRVTSFAGGAWTIAGSSWQRSSSWFFRLFENEKDRGEQRVTTVTSSG
jgi:hypothetical protein